MGKKMINRMIKPFLLIGMIGCFTCGSNFIINLYNAFWGPEDIWWTHNSMKIAIEESTNSIQVFIGGKPLQNHFPDKSLQLIDAEGKRHPVVSQDVRVRVNNWNKVKSRYLTFAVFTGVGLGMSLAFLICGLIGRVPPKGTSH